MGTKYDSKEDLIVLGAGGHAKVIVDIIKKYYKQYNLVGLLAKTNEKNKQVLGTTVLGTDNLLEELFHQGIHKAIIGIGMIKDYRPRERLYQLVKHFGYQCINVIHQECIVSDYVVFGEGNVFLAGAIINADVIIGNNCIINTGSIIEHDSILGNNIHIGPGAILGGEVIVEDNCMIGMGANIIQGVKVERASIVGAGSVVISNVPAHSIVAGVPAKIIKNISEMRN